MAPVTHSGSFLARMTSNAPLGEDTVGTEVARDFGEAHGGVFLGHVVSGEGRRRKFYHVRYTDGDEEDLDHEELCFAFELAQQQKDPGEVCDDDSNGGKDNDGRGGKEASSSSEGRPSRTSSRYGAESQWYNVSKGGRRFKPVLTRERMRQWETDP